MANPTAGLASVAAAVLLAAACSDVVNPERRSLGVPAFSHTASQGIALDQLNGSLRQQNTTILQKGFDPTNPHHGSTVIATFFWLGGGSTNIITSVTDHLNDGAFTPVGNTYRLVEFVTSGGISMATYVATNVQGYPDPNPPFQSVLVVRANLSQSVPDGGVKITAWTGVEPVWEQAVGEHRSGSGSGSAPTVAAPGAITLGAGSLAYAVTLANAVVFTERPAGFTQIGEGSDDVLKEDGEYLVTGSAASVDPRWTWHFQSPSTWLATVLALKPAVAGANQPPTAAFTFSCTELSCNFTDGSSDPDGSVASWMWDFGDGGTATSQNAAHTYAAGGDYTVTLTVTDNEGASNSATQTVSVGAANQPPAANFTFSCTGLACTFTDASSDLDGSIASWQWDFGDGGTATSQNAAHTYAAGGTYAVTLTVTDDQGATGSTTTNVAVSAPAATRLVFTRQPPSIAPLLATFAVTVTALDAQGNVATGFTGTVTLFIATDASLLKNAGLLGTTTVNAVNGVATFPEVRVDQTGVGYKLGARATGLTGATSNAFTVIL